MTVKLVVLYTQPTDPDSFELHFADQGALEAGLGSPEGRATAADYQQIVPLD